MPGHIVSEAGTTQSRFSHSTSYRYVGTLASRTDRNISLHFCLHFVRSVLRGVLPPVIITEVVSSLSLQISCNRDGERTDLFGDD